MLSVSVSFGAYARCSAETGETSPECTEWLMFADSYASVGFMIPKISIRHDGIYVCMHKTMANETHRRALLYHSINMHFL